MDQGADPGALVVRIDRLENQLRAANGAIEELQNQQHRLEDQLKRFQEDVEFRLGGAHGATPPVAEAAPMAATPAPAPAKPVRRSDAFDPAADPNAPGAPRPIGTTPAEPAADQSSGRRQRAARIIAQQCQPAGAARRPARSSAQGPTVIAGIEGPPDDPREMFNAAMETFRVGQYEQAEQQLRAFLSHNAQ